MDRYRTHAWLRRAGVLVGIALVGGLGMAGAARADARPTIGWWYQSERSELGSAPVTASTKPPNAPSDGLYLSAGPSGELSVAAIRFGDVASGPAVLTLRAADGGAFSRSTPVTACRAKRPWKPAQGGDWSERAVADCEGVAGGADGVAATDGTRMTWTLSPAFEHPRGVFNVVLLPQDAPAPYGVAVAAPAADALASGAAVSAPSTPVAAAKHTPSSAVARNDAAPVAASVEPASSSATASTASSPSDDRGASRDLAANVAAPEPSSRSNDDGLVVVAGIVALLAMAVVTLVVRRRSIRSIRQRARELGGALRVERRLVVMLRPYWMTVAGGLAVSIAMTGVGLAKPWPTKILVDDVLGNERLGGMSQSSALVVAVGLTMSLFLLSGGLGLLQTRILFGLSQRAIQDLRAKLFGHLTRLSLRYHDERGAGDGIYRVSTDTYAVQSVLLDGLVPLVTTIIMLVGTMIVMAHLDAYLAVLALVSAPVAGIVASRFGARIRDDSMAVHERESEVYAHAEQTLGSIRTVQAFGRESYEFDRFRARAAASRGAMMRLVTKQTMFGLAVDFVLALGLALVTWVAARRALSGQLTAGEVLVLLAYAGSLYGPIAGLASIFGELAAAAAGAQRVFDVLDEPVPRDAPGLVAPSPRAIGDVRFEAVTFGYVHEHPVVENIELEARRGQMIALVGPTGAGKSTLVSLLLRLYDPDAGRVTLDGRDIRTLPQQWLRDQIAYVPQDPVLFPVSVRENIRYGRLDATDAEVDDAARQANVLDELTADPRGLDAPLGDRGVTLSGGQRQRVAIARAFLRDAPIVVLDEPTSALDAATEAAVMDAAERLLADRTAIVIAHRLATVHRADQVVVVEHGTIVQRGRHHQLVVAKGLYRQLHRARFGSERPKVVALPRSRTSALARETR